jgi:putative endonuclease
MPAPFVSPVGKTGFTLDRRRCSCSIFTNLIKGYVYILQCSDGCRYDGSTNNLIRRLADHCKAQVQSTKWRLPIKLVYFAECETVDDARRTESSLKNGRTRRHTIDRMIASMPADRLAPFAAASQGLTG